MIIPSKVLSVNNIMLTRRFFAVSGLLVFRIEGGDLFLADLDALVHELQELVHFLLGVVDSEAYADHAGGAGIAALKETLGLFVGHSEKSPDIGVRAEGPAPGGNARSISHLGCQVVGVHVLYLEGDDADSVTQVVAVSVDYNVASGLEAVNEFFDQGLFVCFDGVKAHFLEDLHGASHADNAGIVG